MHKESSVLCQCFVDANAVKVKLLCQVDRSNIKYGMQKIIFRVKIEI